MSDQKIMLQIELFVDKNGEIRAAPAERGESFTIDHAAVKSSSRTCVKKSEGEILVKRIRDAMKTRGVTADEISRKTGIGKTTLYAYLRTAGNAPLSKLMEICRLAGISQITLNTAGKYN